MSNEEENRSSETEEALEELEEEALDLSVKRTTSSSTSNANKRKNKPIKTAFEKDDEDVDKQSDEADEPVDVVETAEALPDDDEPPARDEESFVQEEMMSNDEETYGLAAPTATPNPVEPDEFDTQDVPHDLTLPEDSYPVTSFDDKTDKKFKRPAVTIWTSFFKSFLNFYLFDVF